MADRSRQIKRLATVLEKEGWRVKRSTKGWRFYPPNPEHSPMTVHETAGTYGQVWLLRDLRARGYEGPLP